MRFVSLTNAICLECGNFSSERFNFSIKAVHLCPELFHSCAERVFAGSVFNQTPHCIAGEIRDAASAGGLTESPKRGVLFFREADTDHAGAWFEDGHGMNWLPSGLVWSSSANSWRTGRSSNEWLGADANHFSDRLILCFPDYRQKPERGERWGTDGWNNFEGSGTQAIC